MLGGKHQRAGLVMNNILAKQQYSLLLGFRELWVQWALNCSPKHSPMPLGHSVDRGGRGTSTQGSKTFTLSNNTSTESVTLPYTFSFESCFKKYETF